MATTDNSLRPYLDRTSNTANPPSAINPSRSPQGSYLDSVITASLYALDGGGEPQPETVDFTAATGNDSLAIVLFASDAPASVIATQFDTVLSTSPAAPAAKFSTTAAGGLITAAPPTTASITPDAGPFQAGEVQTYTLGTATGAPGNGYSFEGVATPDEDASTILVQAVANSGVVSGWAATTGIEVTSAGAVTQVVQNVLLAAQDYTAEIEAAGNLITIEVAGVSIATYRVVGVWEQFNK